MARQIQYILIYVVLFFGIDPAFAQTKISPELKAFNKHLAKTSITFTFPAGFKEVKPGYTDDYGFDYGIASEEGESEIWFKIRSQKDNLAEYLKKGDKRIINPDSLYQDIGLSQANAFKNKSDERPLFIRSIPPITLNRYNADLGKTYLISLPDEQETKHYKFAMLVILQKNKVGTVMAVCFANELGPGFFKNLNKASSCLKFN